MYHLFEHIKTLKSSHRFYLLRAVLKTKSDCFPNGINRQLFLVGVWCALHWSPSWDRSIQSIPSHPIVLRSILILSNHPRLGLLSGLFPSGFPTNILYVLLPIRVTCPTHVSWVPCHHGMARPQVAVGGDGPQIWRVAANILNKQ
jgi:hypothetical protein